MTIAQKRNVIPGPILPCFDLIPSKNGICNPAKCKDECIRKRNGAGFCRGLQGKMNCGCSYKDNKDKTCSP
ncbi:hypothetical protein N665_0957s0010 [Sinapis alba]|nr:hypothetical protein N665_0957s0010 [Sinapis alba]